MINKKAASMITVIVIIALIALVLRVAIAQIVRINISQNESAAQSTLKLLSTALENFAKDNLGSYPQELSLLTRTSPPYLDSNFSIDLPLKGYMFVCPRLDSSGYSCTAFPIKCNLSGERNFTVSTGGALISEQCKKGNKEEEK